MFRRFLVVLFTMSMLLLAVSYEVDATERGQEADRDSRVPVTTSTVDVPNLGAVTKWFSRQDFRL